MLIDKTIYRGIEIELYYKKENETFYATSKVRNSYGKHITPLSTLENIKTELDFFLKKTPKTYAQLAEAITDYLVWVDDEETCYADEEIIKQLVSSFIKTQK